MQNPSPESYQFWNSVDTVHVLYLQCSSIPVFLRATSHGGLGGVERIFRYNFCGFVMHVRMTPALTDSHIERMRKEKVVVPLFARQRCMFVWIRRRGKFAAIS